MHVVDDDDKTADAEDDEDALGEDEVFRPSYTDDCDQLENPEGVTCNEGDLYRKIDGRSREIIDVIGFMSLEP